MYEVLSIPSDDPMLESSPLVRALDFLAAKFAETPTGIQMTKNMAFRRDLVAEAISIIQWPEWTPQDIYDGYMPVKVADEYHFEPFWELHYLLLRMKLARHYKGKLVLIALDGMMLWRSHCCLMTLNMPKSVLGETLWGTGTSGLMC